MSDFLSSELVGEILSHVPVVPLFRFKCVCKMWRNIIEDSSFIESHLRRQTEGNHPILIKTTRDDIHELHTLPLESLYNNYPHSKKTGTLVKHDLPCLPHEPVAMCNGLILMISPRDDSGKEVWMVLNPYITTQKPIRLAPVYDDDVMIWDYCGIGYDASSADYNVVRISQCFNKNNNSFTLKTLIYNLRLDYWRRVDDYPNCYYYHMFWQKKGGVFFNGALHWIPYIERRELPTWEVILAFDLETEKYRLLPLPSFICDPINNKVHSITSLSVLDECLFVTCLYLDSIQPFDGWIMKDYGSTNSWTKLFSYTSLPKSIRPRPQQPKFVAYLKKERQVLIHLTEEEFVWFDIEKKTAKDIIIVGAALNYFSPDVFFASLVRLNDHKDGHLSKLFV